MATLSAATDVRRAAVLRLIQGRNALVVVLCAPGGYGKSITAAQAAAEFHETLWINAEGRSLRLDDLAQLLIGALEASFPRDGELAEPRARGPHDKDPIDAMRKAVEERSFGELCVVFDGVGREASLQDLATVGRLLRDVVGPRSMLIVTARDIALWRPSSSAYDILTIGVDLLAFSRDEARSLAEALCIRDLDDATLEACYDTSQGQAALFDLLVRHPGILLRDARTGDHKGMPATVRLCLQSLITALLEPWEVEVLRFAAMLSEGDLECLARCIPESSVQRIEDACAGLATKLPLFRVSDAESLAFRVHDLVFDAVDVRDLAADGPGRSRMERVVHELVSSNRCGRALFVADRARHIPALVDVLERCSRKFPADVSMSEVRRYLSRIPAQVKIERPDLVYLEGYVLQFAVDAREALARYELAERIASSVLDMDAEARGLLRQLMMFWNSGLIRAAEACASRLRPMLDGVSHSFSIWAKAWELMLAAEHTDHSTLLGECHRLYQEIVQEAQQDEELHRACTTLGCVYSMHLGEVPHSMNLLSIVRNAEVSGRTSFATGALNVGDSLVITGRLDAAMKLIEAAIEESRRQGVSSCQESARQTKGMILATAGRLSEAIPNIEEAYASAVQANRIFEVQATLLDYSMLLRAAGEPAQALEKAESACALLETLEWRLFRFQARTERLASLLALGDEELVYGEGVELRKEHEDTGYSYYLLRLDMVLAEVERRRGLIDQAASRIAGYADHIRGEGSNWHMAMYTRAFPGLLGVFARALGPDGIPIHMLRMLYEPWATTSLDMARSVLDAAAWKRLVLRTLGKASGAAFLAAYEGPPVLKVRLFGGLSVDGPHGQISDKAWGKRKARLLFAMLAMNRGRDLPRDVIFERLWPDMPVEKAQSNFYVTWSHMKKALSPGGGPCPYLEHRGGVCRVVPEAVHTDLAEFFEMADELRRAEVRGDEQAVIAAAERMAELHSGELLAGDLYEDWCSEMRERVRHELSDAMLIGAETLAACGALDRAVRLVRHALVFDPWREDLYQAALRYQIVAGQRSSAIETYMACRAILAEDLGLDPSQETQRLYEKVLAMEDKGETVVFQC